MGKMKELDIMLNDIDQLKEEVHRLENNTANMAEAMERMASVELSIINVLEKHGLFDYTKEEVT